MKEDVWFVDERGLQRYYSGCHSDGLSDLSFEIPMIDFYLRSQRPDFVFQLPELGFNPVLEVVVKLVCVEFEFLHSRGSIELHTRDARECRGEHSPRAGFPLPGLPRPRLPPPF